MLTALTRYRTFGHRTVRGWVHPQVLTIVHALNQEQLRVGVVGHVAEIGVHHGRFFIALHLLRRPHERSIAIDIFGAQDLNVDGSGAGDEAVFRRNLLRHTGSDKELILLSRDSTTLTADKLVTLGDGPIRMFSVDGGHTAQTVVNDLCIAAGSLSRGGIVIVDDVFNEQWPGVAQGFFNYLASTSALTPFAIGFNKVFLTHAACANQYRAIVEKTARRRVWNVWATRISGSNAVVVSRPRGVGRPKRAIRSVLEAMNPELPGKVKALTRRR